ncbi:DctP family TRAP transporter solute-binding subunit [Advenella sp. RU8]|uniref:DctP family TRAP transporter solute-binding subunit n=1 Tax=Advenella sp. RU8 TaxID=3399575 RepID=UPI003AAA83F3
MKLSALFNAFFLSVAVMACLSATEALANNYKSEYKLSIVADAQVPWGQGAQIWADLVKERTAGRINIKIYPGASLVQGEQTREFTAIRQGVIDMAVGSTINWSPQVKQLNIFSMPFLIPDYAAVDALVQGEVGRQLFSLIDNAGVVPLAWGENGFRQISNAKQPIKLPEDMKGMKLRVVGSPLFLDIFTALGAVPVQMSWAEAQPALAKGTVDGQENPLSIYLGSKLYDAGQKYLTLWNYVNDPLVFVVNKNIWNSWTAQDREIVRQAALDAARQEVALARKGFTPEDESLLKEIVNHGVEISALTSDQHEAFVKATRPVFDKWKERIGAALVDQALMDIENSKK